MIFSPKKSKKNSHEHLQSNIKTGALKNRDQFNRQNSEQNSLWIPPSPTYRSMSNKGQEHTQHVVSWWYTHISKICMSLSRNKDDFAKLTFMVILFVSEFVLYIQVASIGLFYLKSFHLSVTGFRTFCLSYYHFPNSVTLRFSERSKEP